MADFVGQLAEQISGKITGSISGFASGAKSSFVSANPAVFGPGLAGLEKLGKMLTTQSQKENRQEKERHQRERAFDEENQLEERKLFTDMLKEQKKTNYWLEEILKAILKCCKCDCREDNNKLLAAVGALGVALAAGLAGLYKILDSIKGLLSGLRIPGAAGIALPDVFSRLGKMLDEFAKALNKALASLKSLRIPNVQNSVYRAVGSVERLMNTVDREFAYTTRLLTDRMASIRRSIMMIDAPGAMGRVPALPSPGATMRIPAIPGATGAAAARLKVPSATGAGAAAARIPSATGAAATRPLGTAITRPLNTIRIPGYTPPGISYAPSPILNTIDIEALNRQYAYAGRASAGGGGGFGGGGGGFSAGPTGASAGAPRNFPIVPRRDFLPVPGAGGGGAGDVIDVAFREISEPGRSLVPAGQARERIVERFKPLQTNIFDEILKGIESVFGVVKTSITGFFSELANTKIVQALLPALRRLPIIGVIIDGILSVIQGILTAFDRDKVAETLGIDAEVVSMQNRISAGIGTAIGTFFGGIADLIVGLADYTLGNLLRRLFGEETKTFTESVLEQDTFKTLLSEFFSNVFDNAFDILSGTFKVLIGGIDAIFTGNTQMLEEGLESISDALDDLYTPFDNWSMRIATSMLNAGSAVLNGITGFINDAIGTLIDNVPFASDAWKAGKKKDLFIDPVKTDRVAPQRTSRKKQKAADLAANRKDVASESQRMLNKAPKPSTPPGALPTVDTGGYSPMSLGGLNNLSPTQRQMADQIYNSFKSAGFTDEQAMGAVVNAFAESGFNPSAQNITSREASYGLFQMNTQGGLGTGYDPSVLKDPMTNIQLAIAAAAKQPDFLNARTVEEATAAFTKTVMRPANTQLRAQERASSAPAVLAALGIGGPPTPVELQRQKDLDKQTNDINLIADATSQSAKIHQQTYNDSISRVNTTALTSDQPKITVQPDVSGQRVQTQTQEGVELTAENVTTQTQVLQQQHVQMTQIEQEKMQRDMHYFNERRSLEAQFYGTMTNKLDQLIQVGMFGGRGGGPSSTSAGYNLADKYLGSKLTKILGPEFGAIATTLVGSYTDQFIGTTLGAFLPETGGAGVNRAINAYLSGDKKGAGSELIYGLTGIPTDMRTLVGSQYGFGANASTDFAKDLSTVLGKPFESLFRIGETPGTAQRLLYGPDTQLNRATGNLTSATENLTKSTESIYSLSTGGKAPGMGGGTGVYYYDPGTGQKIYTSSTPSGTVTPGAERTYDQALANVKSFGVNVASQLGAMELVNAIGVKDPLAAMALGTGISGGLRYIGTTALTKGAEFTLAGFGTSLVEGFKGMFDPAALGTAIGGGLIKAGSGAILSGTSIGGGMTAFGAGMKTPSMIGQPWMSTAGNLGAALGGVMAGFSTYSTTKLLSRGYEVKGVAELAGVLGAAAQFGMLGTGAALGSTIGGAAGFLGMNPVGLAILGGAVLLNSLFGKKKKVTGSGIAGTLGEDSTDLQSYVDTKTSRKFGGSSTSTAYSALDPQQLKFYQETINSIFDGVRTGAQVLGLNADAITGFTKSIKVNLQGKTNEQALKAIEAEFTLFTNEMLAAAYPDLDQFKIAIRQDDKGNDVFEDLITTFNRLVEATRFMDVHFEMLGYTLEDLSTTIGGKTALQIADIKFDLSTVFGGENYAEQLDNFSKATQNFFEVAYTEEEKLLFFQKQQQDAIDRMNQSISSLTGVGLEDVNTKFSQLFGKTTEESIKNYRAMVDEFVETTGLSTPEQQAAWSLLIQGIDVFKAASDTNLRLAELGEKEEKKTISFEEVFGLRPSDDIVTAGGFQGVLADPTVMDNLSYVATTFGEIGGASVSGVSGSGTSGGSSEFLSADNASRGGDVNIGGTTVVDNSVKQVSSPRTTVVMNDDKVRDYHPILHNFSRHTLAAFTPGCR